MRMSKRVIVTDVKLNDHRGDFIRMENRSSECFHEWEFHMWDTGRAYCPKCGSFATATNDPRKVQP